MDINSKVIGYWGVNNLKSYGTIKSISGEFVYIKWQDEADGMTKVSKDKIKQGKLKEIGIYLEKGVLKNG